ncbi:M48 family metallopeptidase [Arthrobacter sp. HY1533]|uniref:M48 family metallopeptidase n=1 Tax=Arthrobacter sp. HY1533 TaxID=2970919 RepID=UPI0022BA0F76|nr:SprT family zinc-dependent metalloprotease [Arthrobacter sp. HY1533]
MTELHTLQFGTSTIHYRVGFRDRATLAISVEPTGDVVVAAPQEAGFEAIAEKVRIRGRWILQQQAYFRQFTPRTPPRQYVPGETHLYLGRRYRLRMEPGTEARVRAVRGFFLVSGVDFYDAERIKTLLDGWYLDHARIQFSKRLQQCRERFPAQGDFTPSSIKLQAMKSRWGSMSASGRLLLHPHLVRAPVDGIDYVITHELCHLEIPNHSRDFYQLLTKVMPDWEKRKDRLELFMA